MTNALQSSVFNLDKSEILHLPDEFDYVKRNGHRITGRFMIVNWVESPDNLLRIGIIVSRKFNKRAIKRNRARRLIKESYRLTKSRISKQIWIIIIPRKLIDKCKCPAVIQEFQSLMTTLNVLN